MTDMVSHPAHYTSSPARTAEGSSIECIDVTEHMSFNLGSAIKYIWRCDDKGDATTDLKKAIWYIARELERREKLEERVKAAALPAPKRRGRPPTLRLK